MIRKVLWIAITPLCLTVLLAAPTRAAQPAPATPETAHTPPAEHAVVANPIQNFIDFGYASKDAHGGKLGDEEGEHKMPPPFSMALLNFGVLLALIGKYAAPSLRRMVVDRHDAIAKQLAESSRLRQEAQAKLDEYTRKIAGLDAEIEALKAGLRAEADAEKARLIAEAEARAKRMQEEAQQQIDVELQRVRAALEREVVQAAMAVAETILREKMTDADQRALAERFVASVGRAQPSRSQS